MSAPGGLAEKTGRLSLCYKRREILIARAEVVVTFLALIRTLTAGYQLRVHPGDTLPAGQVGPIITGSLVAAVFASRSRCCVSPAGTGSCTRSSYWHLFRWCW